MYKPEQATLEVPYAGHPGESHRIVYYTWGNKAAPPVVCVHGLTRNGRDFDYLADALSADFYVIAPDMPGRGKSQWLEHKEEYSLACYVANTLFLLNALGIGPVHWVGTSMGGLLGMLLAANVPQRIRSLVLNDVGAQIPGEALARLGTYVGVATQFPGRAMAEALLRKIYTPFHMRDEAMWQHMFRNSLEDLPDGSVRLTYDPAIGAPLSKDPAQPDMQIWEIWQEVKCPVLLVHGEQSDILTAATAEKMRGTHPGMQLHTVPDTGHAPTLADDPEITRIHHWLKKLEN